MPNLFKTIVKKTAAGAGYVVLRTGDHYMQDGLHTLHGDHFRREAPFQAAYGRGIQASHGVDAAIEWRVHVALWAASTALHVPGDFMECGVNAGFVSSAILERLHWNGLGRKFYLVDTFAGPVLPQYSEQETKSGRRAVAERAVAAGAYVTDLARIRANYSEWPDAIVVQGVVPGVLSTLNLGSIAFLHLDMNCAYPERAALEYLWDRLSSGAVVLLDDYSYLGQQEQTMALDAAARAVGAEILTLPTGQGLIIK